MSKASLALKAAFLLVTDLTDYINDPIHPRVSAADTVLYPPSSGHLMFSIVPLLLLAIASHAWPEARENQHAEYLRTCHKIAKDISSASQVFFPRARLVLLPTDLMRLI